MRRNWLKVCLLLALSFLILPSVGVVESKAVKLDFALQMPQAEQLDVWKKTIEAFEKEHPDISVNLINIPSGYREKLTLMIAGGTAPDVTWEVIDDYSVFATQGLYLDLKQFIKRDPEFKAEEYFAPLMKGFEYNGVQCCIPLYFSCGVLFYNIDLFEEAGLGYPDDTWDWDMLTRAGTKLTRIRPDGTVGQWGLDRGWWYTAGGSMAQQAGGGWWNERISEVWCDRPESIIGFQFFIDLATKYKISPEGAAPPFISGQVAMRYYDLWQIESLRAQADFRWDVAPLPHYRYKSTWLDSQGLGILKSTKHPQEAWELVKFLTGPKAQKMRTTLGTMVPSRRDVVPDFLRAPYLPENKRAFIDSVQFGRFRCISPYWTRLLPLLIEETDRKGVWSGKENLQNAMVRVKSRVEALIRGK